MRLTPQVAMTYFDAGLPNITGYAGGWNDCLGASWSGAMYLRIRKHCSHADTGGGNTWNIFLDASLSSPVYGRSTTVQPKAATVNYFIKAK